MVHRNCESIANAVNGVLEVGSYHLASEYDIYISALTNWNNEDHKIRSRPLQSNIGKHDSQGTVTKYVIKTNTNGNNYLS